MAKILIVYFSKTYPLRASVRDHLYSFQRYSSHRTYYLNVAVRGLPWYLKQVSFDLIVFHTSFFSARATPDLFERLTAKLQPLAGSTAAKAAMPQDEFVFSEATCRFINDFGVDHLFTAASESEWPKLYGSVDRGRVTITRVLTGYLDDQTVSRINQLAASVDHRDIDVGYRARRHAAWIGRHGLLKHEIADLFEARAAEYGLVTDISTDEKDVLYGDDWYRFLLRCKYTIGVEGGSSILDPRGEIKKRTDDYLARNPNATLEEVEAACFPGLEGSISLFAISPRHLEACVTRTCQVLVEGDYNGILKSGTHYIELKKDLSNAEDVLEQVRNDALRDEIATRAYEDVVESGDYTYRTFVRTVQAPLAGLREATDVGLFDRMIYRWAQLADRVSWGLVALMSLPRNVLRRALTEEDFTRVAGKIKRSADVPRSDGA